MNIVRPTSDRDRQKFLLNAGDFVRKCMKHDEHLPFACLSARLNTMPGEYEQTHQQLRKTHSLWRDKVAKRVELNEKLSRLSSVSVQHLFFFIRSR